MQLVRRAHEAVSLYHRANWPVPLDCQQCSRVQEPSASAVTESDQTARPAPGLVSLDAVSGTEGVETWYTATLGKVWVVDGGIHHVPVTLAAAMADRAGCNAMSGPDASHCEDARVSLSQSATARVGRAAVSGHVVALRGT